MRRGTANEGRLHPRCVYRTKKSNKTDRWAWHVSKAIDLGDETRADLSHRPNFVPPK